MIVADSNVLLDVIDGSGRWYAWSVERLDEASPAGIVIFPVVYAEIAPAFTVVAELDAFLSDAGIVVVAPERDALFRAGRAHARYRDRGGERERVLPDFLIGAQTDVLGWTLLTRDPRRYRTYFPDVRLITP